MKFNILFTLAITLVLTACSGEKEAKTAAPAAPKVVTEISSPSATMTSMRMQKWALTDYQYKEKGHLVQLKKAPYLIFRDGRASGFGGCNAFSGKYIEGKNKGLNLTLNNNNQPCKDGIRIENDFMILLRSTSEYALNEEGNKLILTGTNGLLNFVLK